MLMFTLLLALTSCSGEVSANKTVAEPSKESVEILKEFASLAATITSNVLIAIQPSNSTTGISGPVIMQNTLSDCCIRT